MKNYEKKIKNTFDCRQKTIIARKVIIATIFDYLFVIATKIRLRQFAIVALSNRLSTITIYSKQALSSCLSILFYQEFTKTRTSRILRKSIVLILRNQESSSIILRNSIIVISRQF